MEYNCNRILFETISNYRISDYENPTFLDKLDSAERGAMNAPFFMVSILFDLVKNVILLFGAFTISVNFSATITTLVVLLFFLTLFLKKNFASKRKIIHEKLSEFTRKKYYIKGLLTSKASMFEVKILNISEKLLSHFIETSKEILSLNKSVIKKESILGTSINLCVGIIVAFVWIKGGSEVNRSAITVGSLVFFTGAFTQLQGVLNQIASSSARIYEQLLHLKDFHIIIEDGTGTSSEGLRIKEVSQLEIKNLTFTYPNISYPALDQISMSINKPGLYSIVGENGSGKSTFLKILLGAYREYEGSVSINGIEITDIFLEDYWNTLTIVSQEQNRYYFDYSTNISFGDLNRNLNIAEMDSATKSAHIYDKIHSSSNGYLTKLGRMFGRKSEDLSGGLWQRLFLSRVFYADTNFIILDEPTSNMDIATEVKIFEHIKKLSKTKIVLCVSHKFYNVKNSDHIFVFDKGSIVEEGNHESLTSYKSLYSKMYHEQKRLFN